MTEQEYDRIIGIMNSHLQVPRDEVKDLMHTLYIRHTLQAIPEPFGKYCVTFAKCLAQRPREERREQIQKEQMEPRVYTRKEP